MKANRPVYIIGGKRIPFVKSMTSYMGLKTNELMAAPLKELAYSFALRDAPLGDVALGALMNSASNWNLARESVLDAGLHPSTPAYNVQRACGTSLETALQIALKISNHQIDDGIAGGVDSNSDLPIEVSEELRDLLLEANAARTGVDRVKVFTKLRPHHLAPRTPAVVEPKTGLSMGQHCEKMVKEWGISREEQDALAYRSHMNAVKAYETGFYNDLVVTFNGVDRDGTIRPETTVEKLGKLKPAFDRVAGTLTAGNSSPLTDGAAAVLLASEETAAKRNWTPLARFVDAQSAALDYVTGEGLLMAPTIAVAKLLARNGLTLQDFDFYEIHEAFAGQVLCTLKAWESDEYCRARIGIDRALGSIDREKMNVVGGSVALGHPFAATGARIVGTLAKLIHQNGKGRGLISICTAGGMGVAAIIEAV